ncbi:hypothetical protein GCM10007276_34240 [Agaricicola taiwanensis]|uniref:Uncharacterized protein n=1 Tax=Agaricicola taiwanensis TaxID=591372 RepID=A0A8J3DZ35_9RHOB|nr:hypothetical protein GCM10007276_34240 [Agaricicola taiwanensis]
MSLPTILPGARMLLACLMMPTLAACASSASPRGVERRLPDPPADCAPGPLPPVRSGMSALVVAAEQRSTAAMLNMRLSGCRAAWTDMQNIYGGKP